jgi:hypothetical protein
MLLENGTYPAVVKDISLYARGELERLTAALRLECEGKELLHREWLQLNDGTISERAIRRLRQCFPKWDGTIEALEEGFCVRDVDVDVTVENEQDRQDPEKWWTRTKYIDPPGGSMSSPALPQGESRTTLVSKYGARFRALSGGSPKAEIGSQKSEDGSQTTDGPPSRPTMPPPAAPVATVTMEECWDAMCGKYPDELREQVGERWFTLMEQVHPGKDPAELGPDEWGRVMAEVRRSEV